MQYANKVTLEVLSLEKLCIKTNTSIAKGRDFGDWTPLQHRYPTDIPQNKSIIPAELVVEDGVVYQTFAVIDTPEDPLFTN